ncbi:hypothetical protein [Leeia oryzae]|uniref:hypothetical protein n=1 Tax=Leeia oryzae TaxID=356662 RepID=UPI0014615854|nr:hypothetical protein [Leeia oryzae]
MQEELERLHLENNRHTGEGVAGQRLLWVDDELPEALAENARLKARLGAEVQLRQLSNTGSLDSKLGQLLIQSVDRPASLWELPVKLWRTWRDYRKAPPSALGGKNFDKVLAAWQTQGMSAVEALLENAAVTPHIQANAYTALARSLMDKDTHHAAEASRRAFALDPKPYRQKWLVLRLHEAGVLDEAEAMLDALPAGIQISESESKQIRQLRHEAEYKRKLEAKQQIGYAEKRAEIDASIKQLTRQCEEQAQQLVNSKRDMDRLQQEKTQLEQSATDRESLLQQQQSQLAEYQNQILALGQTGLMLEREMAELQLQTTRQREENSLLLEQVHQLQEVVESHFQQMATAEQEKMQLLAQAEKQNLIIQELEQERKALAQQLANAELKITDQETQLEKSQSALVAAQTEHVAFVAQHRNVLEALQQAKTLLEQDKDVLTEQVAAGQHTLVAVQAEHEKLVTHQRGVIEALQQAKILLEKDQTRLALRDEEQAKQLLECSRRVSDLEAQLQQRQLEKTELTVRQQQMHEELVRAEAQLDLIKVMVLKDEGL